MRHFLIPILTGLLFTTQVFASCLSIINRINADINHYSTTLNTRHPSWMNLSWLKKMLGNPEVNLFPDQNQIQYKWQCRGLDAYLVVLATQSGKIINVSGLYSTDKGSGLFDTNIITIAQEPDVPKPTNTVQPPQVLN